LSGTRKVVRTPSTRSRWLPLLYVPKRNNCSKNSIGKTRMDETSPRCRRPCLGEGRRTSSISSYFSHGSSIAGSATAERLFSLCHSLAPGVVAFILPSHTEIYETDTRVCLIDFFG
jgi:hypothetical protein